VEGGAGGGPSSDGVVLIDGEALLLGGSRATSALIPLASGLVSVVLRGAGTEPFAEVVSPSVLSALLSLTAPGNEKLEEENNNKRMNKRLIIIIMTSEGGTFYCVFVAPSIMSDMRGLSDDSFFRGSNSSKDADGARGDLIVARCCERLSLVGRRLRSVTGRVIVRASREGGFLIDESVEQAGEHVSSDRLTSRRLLDSISLNHFKQYLWLV
jgi:hypothetical protein